MALGGFQRVICRLIAANRPEQGEAYVAGGVAPNLLTGGRQYLWHRHPADDSWAGSPCHGRAGFHAPLRGDRDAVGLEADFGHADQVEAAGDADQVFPADGAAGQLEGLAEGAGDLTHLAAQLGVGIC